MQGRGLSIAVTAVFLVVCGVVVFLALGRSTGGGSATGSSASAVAKGPTGSGVEIVVSSSDGKKEWLESVAKSFESSRASVGGKPIRVKLIHMKSGESMQKILDGKEKPTIWSPAGGAWIDLINTTWKTRTGHAFVDGAKPTVMSALVVAMWEPMAKALGWPGKPIGWEDIFKVAMDPKGWGGYGHPEWGPFRFGHGHPDFSTSAMNSVISSLYAAAGKSKGLTSEDLKNPKVIEKVTALEKGIVHYGESSSWLTERLCTKGPAYLSAVTLYESNVINANEKYKTNMPFKLVAVYPKEGTFWEDHPSGVVQADWVSPEQKEAAEKFVAYTISKESQEKAISFGYRPSDKSIALGSPIDEAHGADAKVGPDRALEYVSEDVFRRANELWHQVKKHSTVFLLLDVSGSMEGVKMNSAKRGAAQFIRSMQKEDDVGVIAFSTQPKMLRPVAPVREVGETLAAQVEGLFADGQTAMFDATLQAMDEIEKAKKAGGNRLYGVVLLSDGKDTSSKKTLSDLMDRMPATEAADGTRLFTVGYGDDAEADLLTQLANRSNARFLKGNADNIENLSPDLSVLLTIITLDSLSMADRKKTSSLPVTTFISPEGIAVLAAAAGTAVLATMPVVVVPGVLAYGILTYLRYDRWKTKQREAENAEPTLPDVTGMGSAYMPKIQRLYQLQLGIFREVRSASPLHRTLLEPSLGRTGELIEAAVQLSRKLQQLDRHLSNQTESRLAQEGTDLEGKLSRTKDAVARGQLEAALSQHQQKMSVYSELVARRERIDAQLTHLELTLETASAQVVRIKSADAGAASDESAKVVDSLQALSDEVQALAETVEEASILK